MSEKTAKKLGWAGTCMSILMYVAYIAQIMSNLNGEQGQLHPATSCNNKLHAVGDIRILQEGQRLPNYMC